MHGHSGGPAGSLDWDHGSSWSLGPPCWSSGDQLRCCKYFTNTHTHSPTRTPLFLVKSIYVMWVKQLKAAHNGYDILDTLVKTLATCVGHIRVKGIQDCVMANDAESFWLQLVVRPSPAMHHETVYVWMAPMFLSLFSELFFGRLSAIDRTAQLFNMLCCRDGSNKKNRRNQPCQVRYMAQSNSSLSQSMQPRHANTNVVQQVLQTGEQPELASRYRPLLNQCCSGATVDS